jgi:hypothetical protein
VELPATVAEHFSPLLGLPAWCVSRGHGSFVTFEFGAPRLEVSRVLSIPGTVPSIGDRRRVVVPRGEWHLWIYFCDWEIYHEDQLIAASDADEPTIDTAAGYLDGQALSEISMSKDPFETTFQFDLGGRLTTRAIDTESEQWFLYEPDNRLLTIRADQRYSEGPSDVPGGEDWQSLWEKPASLSR